jgi:hypothetical protein
MICIKIARQAGREFLYLGSVDESRFLEHPVDGPINFGLDIFILGLQIHHPNGFHEKAGLVGLTTKAKTRCPWGLL